MFFGKGTSCCPFYIQLLKTTPPIPSDTAGMPLPGPLTPGDHNVHYDDDDYYDDYYHDDYYHDDDYYYDDHQRQCQALRREFM